MAGTASSGGRNKKSQAEHALDGTSRKDRGTKGAPAELLPEPPQGRPAVPLGLAGHALAEWHRMVARLEASNTLSLVDDAALYQYCCLFGETEDVQDQRRENAALVATLQATVGRDPTTDDQILGQMLELKLLNAKHTTQLRQGHMALRPYLVEFGMTPAARSRVKVSAPAAPADPFAEFDGEKPKAKDAA